MTCTLEFADGIGFWLTRKKIKNVNIRIKPPDGRVEVNVPMRMSLKEVVKLVEDKRGWILEKQAQIRNAPSSIAADASDAQKAQWREVVESCVPVLIKEWEGILGVKAGKLVYRNMKSRWGSCQPVTGRICINTRLALYPPECLEYVVVHELCHLLVPGHGSEFKELMDAVMPDWRERRAKLR